MKSKFLIALFSLVVLCSNTVNLKAQDLSYKPKFPKENDFEKIKIDLEKNLKSSRIYCSATDKFKPDACFPVNVLVFNDRIEFTFKGKKSHTFYFQDLVDLNFRAEYVCSSPNCWVDTSIGVSPNNIRILTPRYIDVADNLFYIRYNLINKKLETWLNDFKPVAEKYRSLIEKPSITEEQREYIVQANFFTQQKNYNKAIELYQKVYQINTYSYPAAYSNLALLYANMSDYQSAIYYMKLYLMLEPDANDARASQDKIYEWKVML